MGIPQVTVQGKQIEEWMGALTDMMRLSVREQLLLGAKDYLVCKRTEWMQKWPGQVVLNGSQLHWTHEAESLMRAHGNEGVRKHHAQIVAQLNDMVTLLRGSLSKLARKCAVRPAPHFASQVARIAVVALSKRCQGGLRCRFVGKKLAW